MNDRKENLESKNSDYLGIIAVKSASLLNFYQCSACRKWPLPNLLRTIVGETVIEKPTYYDSSRISDSGQLIYGKGHYFPIRDKAEVVREIVKIRTNFSDLLAAQQKLQQERDHAATKQIKLLETIAQVANLLLQASDYTSVLPHVVRLLGETVGSHRCGLSQILIVPASGKRMVRAVAEWCQPGVSTSIECTPDLELGLPTEIFADLGVQILYGEIVNVLIADLQPPVRDVFVGQGNTSMLLVPIMMQEDCWGVISFDNCGAPRLFDTAEIAILRIAADSITAAIERQQQEKALLQAEQEKQAAIQAKQSAILEERNRMAREIHDVLAQAFTGVVVNLEAAKMITPQDAPLQPLLTQAQDLARAGLVEARRSVWSLRPQALENNNLRSALEQLLQALIHNTLIQIHLQIQGIECAITPEVETHLLRIAQEAINNALTHAQASTIQIELTFGTQKVELCVRDDGQGFEPMAVRGHGFGLISMQERADCINGEFTLTSQPGCGTMVLITAPLSAKSNAPIRRS
ncbi:MULTISPECIES: GAF domain-containing sensor histidine kinase [Nostoc]|uniref:GAF domain-containing sensor histidine kinase n=1 Tax=Nostoc paludosum FACHB-159 TaxID=2692908 RepID=A0ABR8KGI0_9NOSO|nr:MULTISPECIES: GAF domain-containing sensor histidine kinase [Nostoc]MBD2682316.1 GAF domain-containing sensor histidine kinase [Nostoc sp. FACHB-857]MBD2738649.1 GAF domain-containing sensor histidine kinase [Nostoc paludosum FACHB-159]